MSPSRLSIPPCVILAEEVWGSTLHAMRSIGRLGAPVYVVTAGQGAAIYGRSRYCTQAVDLQFAEAASFGAAVRAWAEGLHTRGASVPVLPLSDRLVESLHRSREMFMPHFSLGIPSPAATPGLLNKSSALRLAQDSGLDVPPWVDVCSDADLPLVDTLTLPVAVRPQGWSTVGSLYFKVAVYQERRLLVEDLRVMLARGARLVVQEYVDAPDGAVEFSILWRGRDGSVTAQCTGRKRRQASAQGGVMVWGETDHLPDVADAASRFLDASGFVGLGGIEFIRSAGRLWFIEFNPRLEAIHFLAARAGIDTVEMAYRELALGQVPSTVPPQLPAAAWVGSAAFNRLLQDRSDWRLLAADRLRFQRAPNRTRAVWTWQDPLPGLAVAGRLVSRGTRSILGRSKQYRGHAT